VAFAAAVEETAGQIDVDLDGAEHRNVGGHRGGYGGGFGGGRGGGGHLGGRFGRSPQKPKPNFRQHPQPRPPGPIFRLPFRLPGRFGRSLKEAQPFIVAEFQPEHVDYVSDDLQLAENRYYGGNRRHSSGSAGYGQHSGSNGNKGSSGGSSGYGGHEHRGRRSVEDENAGAIEDLEVAEHDSKGYESQHGGSSGYGNHRRSACINHIIKPHPVAISRTRYFKSRPSGGHGSHSGHGSRY
jgi:hypothetical protein